MKASQAIQVSRHDAAAAALGTHELIASPSSTAGRYMVVLYPAGDDFDVATVLDDVTPEEIDSEIPLVWYPLMDDGRWGPGDMSNKEESVANVN